MPPETRRRKKANLFTNDCKYRAKFRAQAKLTLVKSLLYAYGDVPNPYPETIGVLEDILQEYITAICFEAHRVARAGNRQKLKVEDFKFALRHDAIKLGRVEELLSMQKEINEARKTFDNSEGKSLSKVYDEKEDAAAAAPAGATETAEATETSKAPNQEKSPGL